jgi:hypothetical protein
MIFASVKIPECLLFPMLSSILSHLQDLSLVKRERERERAR